MRKTLTLLIITFLIGLILCPVIFAQEVIVDYGKDSLPVLNEELRRLRERTRYVEDNLDPTIDLTSDVEGILPLANGGTGEALVDPDADRIAFWDDSEGELTWLEPGTNLTITGTTINVTGISSYDEYEAGDSHIEAEALTEATTLAGTYTKVKEFSPVIRSGTVRIEWQMKVVGTDFTGYSKIYINGEAVEGTEKSKYINGTGTYSTQTVTSVTVEAGDIIQIYAYCSVTGSSRTTYIDDVYIKCENPTTPQEAI